MTRRFKAIILILIATLLSGCTSTLKQTAEKKEYLPFSDISAGLPHDGLWRENLVLYDMDGDGFLDIVAPPPRKAEKGKNRPFIFLWDPAGKKWTEGGYVFQEKGYSYGGIAVGDINGDGYPDLALAQHGSGMTLFLNDKGKGFVEFPITIEKEFHSRALALSDLNGDGALDVVAISEARFSGAYTPKGLLTLINGKDGKWDVRFVEESSGLFADSIAVGNLRGLGKRDIAAAVLISSSETQKLIWLGDENGGFKAYEGTLFSEKVVPVIARVGDVDGDGREEAVFGVAPFGEGTSKEKGRVVVLKWAGDHFEGISKGLEPMNFVAFDVADIDGDGKCELILLTEAVVPGVPEIHIYKFNSSAGWSEQGRFPVPIADAASVTDLKAGRNKDGSVIIVYNLGKYEDDNLNRGIRAFRLK